MKDIFLALDVHGVACVIAALRADYHVGLFRQNINDLSLAFVAPLGPHQNRIGHSSIKIPER